MTYQTKEKRLGNCSVLRRMTPSPSPTELQGWFGKRPDFSSLSTYFWASQVLSRSGIQLVENLSKINNVSTLPIFLQLGYTQYKINAYRTTYLNVKRYLINYPHLFDYGQTIFCLSFPSRDRATAPGRYEQFYFTEHVPYPQKIHFEDAIRSEDPVQLFCNSFCVQHKMVGDDYPSILQCLVYCHSANWRIEIASPCVLQKGYSSSLGNTHPSLKLPAFYVCQTSSGQLLGLPQISLESIRLLFFYVCLTSSGQLLGLPQLS